VGWSFFLFLGGCFFCGFVFFGFFFFLFLVESKADALKTPAQIRSPYTARVSFLGFLLFFDFFSPTSLNALCFFPSIVLTTQPFARGWVHCPGNMGFSYTFRWFFCGSFPLPVSVSVPSLSAFFCNFLGLGTESPGQRAAFPVGCQWGLLPHSPSILCLFFFLPL